MGQGIRNQVGLESGWRHVPFELLLQKAHMRYDAADSDSDIQAIVDMMDAPISNDRLVLDNQPTAVLGKTTQLNPHDELKILLQNGHHALHKDGGTWQEIKDTL